MKSIFAGIDGRIKVDALVSTGAWNWLVSYKDFRTKGGIKLLNYMVNARKNAPQDSVFMLDSGAFSIWNSGACIELWEYINFVLEWQTIFNGCICLDVIDHPVASEVNHRIMKLAGCKNILPVFHSGEPLLVLEKFLDWEYQFFCISPNNSWSTRDKLKWMKRLSKFKFKNVKTHILGFGSPKISRFEYIYSFDTTTWIMIAAVGNIICEDRKVVGVSESQNKLENKMSFQNSAAERKEMILKRCASIRCSLDDLKTSHTARLKFNASTLKNDLLHKPNLHFTLDLFEDSTSSFGYLDSSIDAIFCNEYLNASALTLFSEKSEYLVPRKEPAKTGSSKVRI